MLKTKEELLKRIIIDSNNCWVWTGAKTKFGYGRVKIDGKLYSPHRISYELFNEEPGKLFVCHKCDNPPCINPEHLFLGNSLDNIRDAIQKNRWHFPTCTRWAHGSMNKSAKLNEDKVKLIRLLENYFEWPVRKIALLFSVSHSTIVRICNFEAWKNV